MPRIAVFTKNRTNPAYEAARSGRGPDRGAARRHHHPLCPRQARQRAGADRADRARHRGAARRGGVRAGGRDRGQRRHPGLRRGEHSAVQHHHPHHGGPARHLRRLRRPGAGAEHRALSVRQAAAPRHDHHSRRHAGFRDQPRAAAWASRTRWPSIPASMCEARCAAITSATSPATCSSAPRINGRAWTRCCAPTTSWRSACWMRSMRTRAAGRWWSASTPSPRRSRPSRRGGCSPPPTSTPWR